MNKNQTIKNRYTFGLGTFGRDMVYATVSLYLMFFLTDILSLSDKAIVKATSIIMAARIFDALNDPIMGTIVDNTKSHWGKFKPWILIGTLLSGIIAILIFTPFNLSENGYVYLFTLLYLSWGITYTMNDISYWSMIPALSDNQKEREKIGAFTRFCASSGMFAVVVGIVPLTKKLGSLFIPSGTTPPSPLYQEGLTKGYTLFMGILVCIMWIFQSITLFGVKEPDFKIKKNQSHTSLRGMIKVIFKNDQLLSVSSFMTLFLIGYMTTVNFGLYFFKYAYGNEGMYPIFTAILGVSQLIALIFFPLLSKKWSRKQLYTGSTIGVIVGYLIFFFSPMKMIFIGISGLFIFFFQAIIQILCLVFLTDTVEYGQWKLGKRNESITFSIQPFINKLGPAIASGITGFIVVFSGINKATAAADVTPTGLLIMKITMLIFPMLMYLLSYLVYLKTFKIDAPLFEKIMEELNREEGVSEETDS